MSARACTTASVATRASVPAVAVLAALLGLTSPAIAQNGVTFNFTPAADPNVVGGGFPVVACNLPGIQNYQCEGNPSNTPFLQEVVKLNGKDYYHLIVGLPTEQFAQEIYIETGKTTTVQGFDFSQSGGGWCMIGRFTIDLIACDKDHNGRHPLGAFETTGNGTGNPQTVAMKQLVNDAANGFNQEFLKDQFNKKPKITQTQNQGLIDSYFQVDMSTITYETDTVEGTMTNRLTVKDPSGAPPSEFDLSQVSSAQARVDAGRYKFTPNTGSVYAGTGSPAWNYGTYTYYDGSIDPVNTVDWAAFCNPEQNQPGGCWDKTAP